MEEERLIHPQFNTEFHPLEMTRFLRDLPPAHYTFKINSFSQLSKIVSNTGEEKYKSGDFEVGGYKWRLSLYPNGDEKRGGTGHISLYLVLSETNAIPLGLEVNASFRLFVYNQIRDKYLTVQDSNMKERRFHANKTEWGFSKLIPLSTVNDAANGYLIDDCCIFGADVFVTNCTGKGETISIIKEPPTSSFTWKIDQFSSIISSSSTYSKVFIIGGHKWRLRIYPKGNGKGRGKSLSLFLKFEDYSILHPRQKIYVEHKLSVKDQIGSKKSELTAGTWFSSANKCWGWPNFMPISDLTSEENGYIVNDTVIVEAQITLMSTVKNLSLKN